MLTLLTFKFLQIIITVAKLTALQVYHEKIAFLAFSKKFTSHYSKCWNCAPCTWMQATTLFSMFAVTLCSVSKVTFEISNSILCFKSSNVCGLLLYTTPLKVAPEVKIQRNLIRGSRRPQLFGNNTITKKAFQEGHRFVWSTAHGAVLPTPVVTFVFFEQW